MKRSLLILGVFVALGASLASSAMAADAAPAATERLQALDQQVLAALNRTRADHGLRPLVMSDDLQDAAVAHSRAMLKKGFFAHDSPNGVQFVARVRGFYRSSGYDSWTVGENLIYNTDEITADIAIAAWMASPAHRENMLAPDWREVGIGSLHASSAGGLFAGEPTWVITMDFGARSGNVVKHQVAKHKAEPKPAERKTAKFANDHKNGKSDNVVGKHKATPNKPAKPTTAKPAKKTTAKPAKKQSPTPKPIECVLPRPTHDPGDETDDPVDGADDPAAPPEDDVGDAVADPAATLEGDDEIDAIDRLLKP